MRPRLFLLALLATPSMLLCDTVHLRNGTAIDGDIVKSDSRTVQIRAANQVRTIGIDEVTSILFGRSANPAPPAAIAPAEPPKAAAVLESPLQQQAEGFTIRLDRCVRQATAAVYCNFSIANQKADRQIALQAAYMVGSDGLQQRPVRVKLANAGQNQGTPAVYNTPVPGELQFGGVTPNVDRIAKLSLSFGAFGPTGNANFEIVYRNVGLPLMVTSDPRTKK